MALGSFTLQLKGIADKTKARTGAVVRKIVIDLGTQLVERSPVGDASYWQSPPPPGYVGGRFRANWQYSFGAPPTGDLPDIDPSGRASTGRITAGVFGHAAAGRHYIINNLPYAQALEEGWSHRQAPAGIVGVTLVNFDGIVREAAAS